MKKKIAMLFIMIVIMNFSSHILLAATNPKYPTAIKGDDSSWVTAAVGKIGKTLGSPIFGLAAIILLTFESILNMGFQAISSHGFPYADSVIFNAVPILDANFINPTTNTGTTEGEGGEGDTPLSSMQGTVINLYGTIWGLAAAFFSVALIFIGIKLATESIAHQKAKYKEALLSWIVGIVLLFMIHFFMSFILSLNEELVIVASNVATEGAAGDMKVTSLATQFRDNIIVGYNLFDFTSWLSLGIQLDFTNVILWGILLGQSVIVLFAYFKRVFYVIVLAFFAPVIVVINTYQKTLMGKSSSLSKWATEFIVTVMQQTMQAFIYALVIKIIAIAPDTSNSASNLTTELANADVGVISLAEAAKGNTETNPGYGIISIGALFLVMKLDDIARNLLGFKPGMDGGLSGGFHSFMMAKSLGSSALRAGKNMGDNVGKFRQGFKDKARASKDEKAATEAYERSKSVYGEYSSSGYRTADQLEADNSGGGASNQIKDLAAGAVVINNTNEDDAPNNKNNGNNINTKQEQEIYRSNADLIASLNAMTAQILRVAQGGGQGNQILGADGKPIASAGRDKNGNVIGSANVGQGIGSQQAPSINMASNGDYLEFETKRERDKARRDMLHASQDKAAYDKAMEAAKDARKKATQLQRSAVGGTMLGAAGTVAGGVMAAGSGDIKLAIAGASFGTTMGDKIGEEIGKAKILDAPGIAAGAIDAKMGYKISEAITGIQEKLYDNVGTNIRKSQASMLENMAQSNNIAFGTANEAVEALQKKQSAATDRINDKVKAQAKRSGKDTYVQKGKVPLTGNKSKPARSVSDID